MSKYIIDLLEGFRGAVNWLGHISIAAALEESGVRASRSVPTISRIPDRCKVVQRAGWLTKALVRRSGRISRGSVGRLEGRRVQLTDSIC